MVASCCRGCLHRHQGESRTCQLARCLVEYFTTYYHRQQREAIYGGAYTTLIGHTLGHLHQDTLEELSDLMDQIRLDRWALFGMKIVRDFSGVGLRFSLVHGVIWVPPPLQMIDVDEGLGVRQAGEGAGEHVPDSEAFSTSRGDTAGSFCTIQGARSHIGLTK
ncbi:hypothetical protein R6Q57_011618 [Mikania cordata]